MRRHGLSFAVVSMVLIVAGCATVPSRSAVSYDSFKLLRVPPAISTGTAGTRTVLASALIPKSARKTFSQGDELLVDLSTSDPATPHTLQVRVTASGAADFDKSLSPDELAQLKVGEGSYDIGWDALKDFGVVRHGAILHIWAADDTDSDYLFEYFFTLVDDSVYKMKVQLQSSGSSQPEEITSKTRKGDEASALRPGGFLDIVLDPSANLDDYVLQVSLWNDRVGATTPAQLDKTQLGQLVSGNTIHIPFEALYAAKNIDTIGRFEIDLASPVDSQAFSYSGYIVSEQLQGLAVEFQGGKGQKVESLTSKYYGSEPPRLWTRGGSVTIRATQGSLSDYRVTLGVSQDRFSSKNLTDISDELAGTSDPTAKSIVLSYDALYRAGLLKNGHRLVLEVQNASQKSTQFHLELQVERSVDSFFRFPGDLEDFLVAPVLFRTDGSFKRLSIGQLNPTLGFGLLRVYLSSRKVDYLGLDLVGSYDPYVDSTTEFAGIAGGLIDLGGLLQAGVNYYAKDDSWHFVFGLRIESLPSSVGTFIKGFSGTGD
ncbi:MAG TPA: hypothetical protein VMC79_04700 [Rectinemataceae bacterium]|nr:hypothetical protein [Rectinemataceae bacterium]